jgi:hypothetical protein
LAQITLCLPRRHTSPIWLTGGLFGKDLELTGFEMGEIDLRMASLEDPVHREAKPLKTSVQGDVVQNGVVASLVMVIVASPTSIVASSCTPMGKWAGSVPVRCLQLPWGADLYTAGWERPSRRKTTRRRCSSRFRSSRPTRGRLLASIVQLPPRRSAS